MVFVFSESIAIYTRLFLQRIQAPGAQNSNKHFKVQALQSILWHLVVQIEYRRFVIFGFQKCLKQSTRFASDAVHHGKAHVIIHTKSPLTSVSSRYKSIISHSVQIYYMPLENHVWILSKPLNQHTPTPLTIGQPKNYPNKCTLVVILLLQKIYVFVKMQRLK